MWKRGSPRNPDTKFPSRRCLMGVRAFRVGAAFWIRTACLRQLGGFDRSYWGTEDYDVWMRLSMVAKFLKFNRVSLLYRVHPNSMSSNSLRMFHNAWRVIREGLHHCQPGDRRELGRRGCNAVYAYHAMQLTWEWRRQLVRGRLIQACRSWGGLLKMAGLFARYDPSGLARMARQLLPRALRHGGKRANEPLPGEAL